MPGGPDTPRDRELLSALASGSGEALADLYDRHAASLFRHALVLTGQRPDAEDLVHAVFVKLATLGGELLAVREPAQYFHRMLRTSWIDARRRHATGVRVAEQTAAGAPGWQVAHEEAPEDVLDVGRALASLPEAQREAIVLHIVEGFSFREIGRMTGVSLFTAAGRYRVGLVRLRAWLAGTSRKT